VISLIRRWLKAGVLEDGETHPNEEGTPQGGSISVLLTNLYLHHALDLWFERVVIRMQDLMRRMRHLPVKEQVINLNWVLRGQYAYYVVARNLRALHRIYRVVELLATHAEPYSIPLAMDMSQRLYPSRELLICFIVLYKK
jgi:hypothetical protein